jgi:RNA polymerase sigma-70 factor (family 1)
LGQSILHNEQLLLRETGAGDERAFSELFDHYEPNIYSFVLRTTRSEETAREIVQDTFLKVWLNRENLQTIKDFRKWLHTIVANLTNDALRKYQSHQRLMSELKHDAAQKTESFTSTEDLILDKQYAALLQDALLQLPDRQREAFRLIKQEGFSREEAAAALGVSAETTKTHIERAMQKVRAYCVSRLGTLGLLLYLWPVSFIR